MKSASKRAASFLFVFCFILTLGAVAFAQQSVSKDKKSLNLSASQTNVSEKEKEAFYQLTETVTRTLSSGDMEGAKKQSEALLKQAETMKEDWNYGNAVHVANLVLGHVALARGDVDEAKHFLLAAGNTPGSPQLDSFGPNMRLAKALLEKGEAETVIEYFDLCAKFWEQQFSKTEEWKAIVEKNEMPDFGANLRYQFYDAK